MPVARKIIGFIMYLVLRGAGRNVGLVEGYSSFPYVYPYDVVEIEYGAEPAPGELGVHWCGSSLCVHVYLGGNKWHTGVAAEPAGRVSRVYVNPAPMVIGGRIHVPIKSIRRKMVVLAADRLPLPADRILAYYL